MAHQKVCKQSRYNESEGKCTKHYPYTFCTTKLSCEKDAGRGLCIFTYHTYLVCILFGVPSLPLFKFLMFFFLVSVLF